MTQRIYIGADRVTVSKPGYDAVSPPAVDYKYLSLDSRLNQGRPLEVGVVPSYVFGNAVFYATTYSQVPAVDIFAYDTSSGFPRFRRSVVLRDDNGTTAYQRSSYYVSMAQNGFQVIDRAIYRRSSLFGVTVTLYYIVWQVR